MSKVLVTGGGSGIGAAIARRFSANGHRVVIADFNTETGSAVALEVGGVFEHLDVTDQSAWEAVATTHPDVEILFLNAGTTTRPGEELSGDPETPNPVPLAKVTINDYRRITSVNVDGVVLGTMAFVPLMAARGSGHIVATASMAGLLPFPQEPVYALTKHAVVGFVRSMGAALEPLGVKMSALCPGFVKTNLLTEETLATLREFGLPVISPDRIADAAEMAVDQQISGALWFVNGESPIAAHIPNDPNII